LLTRPSFITGTIGFVYVPRDSWIKNKHSTYSYRSTKVMKDGSQRLTKINVT